MRTSPNGEKAAEFIGGRDGARRSPRLTPHGKFLACNNWRQAPEINAAKDNAEIAVVSTDDPNNIRHFSVFFNPPTLRFSPDGKAIEFITSYEEGAQITRLDLAENVAKPLLQIPNDRIFNFAWSKNGKQMAHSVGSKTRDAVLVSDFDK